MTLTRLLLNAVSSLSGTSQSEVVFPAQVTRRLYLQASLITQEAFKVLSTENTCNFPVKIQCMDTQKGQRTMHSIFITDASLRWQDATIKVHLEIHCAIR